MDVAILDHNRYPLVISHMYNYGQSVSLMGKLTICMADMFNFQRVTFNLAAFTPTTPTKKSGHHQEHHLLKPGKFTFSPVAYPLFCELRGIFDEFIHFLLNIDGVPGSWEDQYWSDLRERKSRQTTVFCSFDPVGLRFENSKTVLERVSVQDCLCNLQSSHTN